MITHQKLTFEEGCNKYLEYCKQKNLRQDTIRHYQQSFIYFYKYLDKIALLYTENKIQQNLLNNLQKSMKYGIL